MTQGKIRLACGECDRDDFDGVNRLPKDWIDITKVQSLKESRREVDVDDRAGIGGPHPLQQGKSRGLPDGEPRSLGIVRAARSLRQQFQRIEAV